MLFIAVSLVVHVGIKNFEDYGISQTKASNTTYVSGASGGVAFLQIIGMMFSRNIIALKLLVLLDQVAHLDFNAAITNKNQMSLNIQR